MTKKPLVEVLWVDSCWMQGWKGAKTQDFTTSSCRTVGYLTRKKGRLIVSMSCSTDTGNLSESMVIPKKCVKKVYKLSRKSE